MLFVIYGIFFKKEPEDEFALSVTAKNQTQTQVGAQILSALATLETLKLDIEFFNDPIFKGLKNFNKEPVPQPKGRNNPFAPIGTTGAPVTPTTPSR